MGPSGRCTTGQQRQEPYWLQEHPSGRHCGDDLSRGCSQDPAAAAASDALQQEPEPLHTPTGSASTCQCGLPTLQQLPQVPRAYRPPLLLPEVLQVSDGPGQ